MDVEYSVERAGDASPGRSPEGAKHLVVPPKLGPLLQHAFNAAAPYELGFTAGHSIITADDEAVAEEADASLLYGEILPTEGGAC